MTGTIGIDTSFLIDFLKGEKEAAAFMSVYAPYLRISELVIYEFLCGNLTKKEQKQFLEAIQYFDTVSFNHEAAFIGSDIFRSAKKRGKTLSHQDCMIAATYVAHGITNIVTSNTKHFSKIKDMKIMTY